MGAIVLSSQQRDRFSGPWKKQAISVLRRSQIECHCESLSACPSATCWGGESKLQPCTQGARFAASAALDPLKQRAQAYPEFRIHLPLPPKCWDSRPTLWAAPQVTLKCALPVSLWAHRVFLKACLGLDLYFLICQKISFF